MSGKISRAFDKYRRQRAVDERKKKLENHSFSIISNTCVGGVITHNLGEQFRSPTVNLIIYEDQFMTFCRNLKAYSECPVEKPEGEESEQFKGFSYPVGILRGASKNLPDIYLFFVHYKTFEDAREKWISRFARVNYDDIFVLMDRGMDAKDEILDEFYSLPYEHKVFLTDKADPERWKYNFKFSYYEKDKYVAGCLYKHLNKGIKQYLWLDEFDYLKWINTGEISSTDIKIYP